MSHSSEEADDRKAEAASSDRMWEEVGAEPKDCLPSRQGYCGYCRLLYSNLDQHLTSLKHLESVQTTTRDSAPSTSTSSILLERFLQDILVHHPHSYQDPRPPHVELPPGSPLRLHWLEPDRGLYRPPRSGETSCLLANQGGFGQQSESSLVAKLSPPIGEEDKRTFRVEDMPTSCGKAQAPPPQDQAPPTVHMKAHRKTNRRKMSDSSPSLLWEGWQETQQETVFSADSPDLVVASEPVGQPVEEVIQRVCHTQSSSSCQQEVFKDLQLSLHTSTKTLSNNWDSALQVELQTPIQMSQSYRQELTCLMGLQVLLEDQVYKDQLHSVLHLSGERVKKDQALLPEPRHVPESFRGKSLAQIQQEDEEKVERLVHQFRRHTFTCYFDTESLARYGRRSRSQKGRVQKEETPSPLDVQEEEDLIGVARRKRERGFRVASRCQVVKLSHSTQTVRLLLPEVRSANQEPTPPSANQEAAVAVTPRPTGGQTCHCLPSGNSPIMTPLQPQTSLLYLLAPPSSQAPWPRPLTMPPGFAHLLAPGSAPRRCRKKRRPLDLQASKVKYKQFSVKFYDPDSHCVLKAPPSLRGLTPSCRRQLFRSLSPDLNAHRPQGEGLPEVKGQTCPTILLSTLSRDTMQASPVGRSKAAKALPTRSHTLRLRPVLAKRSRKTETLPSQAPPRRKGLRRTGSSGQNVTIPPPRGQVRRGRSFTKNSKKHPKT